MEDVVTTLLGTPVRPYLNALIGMLCEVKLCIQNNHDFSRKLQTVHPSIK